MLGNSQNNRDSKSDGRSNHGSIAPNHRFWGLPQDESLERRIERIFSTIPEEDLDSDCMPIATIISAWIIAHLSQYEALPMARLESICARNYVSICAVLHRISHNNTIMLIAEGDTDRLVLKGNLKGLKTPIIIPEPGLDASMNYEDRVEYIINAYGLDQPRSEPRKMDQSNANAFPPFCEPSNDNLTDNYLTKIDPHQEISLSICLVSLAVFYATPRKRIQIRGFAVFLLDELYNSLRNTKNRFNFNHSFGSFGDYVREDS